MNQKNKMLVLSLLSTMMLAPVTTLVLPSLKGATAMAQTMDMQPWLSLGASLNSEEMNQTKTLLGANQVASDHTLMVGGELINQYLNDGSDSSATVYSSAYIEPQQAGYGVQVQIVTPDKITLVTPTTYQNAAITSGAKDIQIKIATVNPVTGEGALAGVYALLAKAGVKVDTQTAQIAQKEIQVVDQVKKASQLSDLQVNQLVSDIKKEVTSRISAGQEIDETYLLEFIKQLAQEKGYQLDQNTLSVLLAMGLDFAKTDAAKSQDTIKQLEQSVDNQLNANWSEVLANHQEVRSTETLIELVAATNYDDISLYHPIIPALYDALLKAMENQASPLEIYSHTFIVETLLNDITPDEHQALNQLRVYLYEYMVHYQSLTQPDASAAILKQIWLAKLAWQGENDTVLNQIIQLIALASGYAPEAYDYNEILQEGSVITFLIKSDEGSHLATAGQFAYDVASGGISDLFGQTMLQNGQVYSYDFERLYGVKVENHYQIGQIIPQDYQIAASQVEESENEMSENMSESELTTSENNNKNMSETTSVTEMTEAIESTTQSE